jgi:hypothetical protein
MPEEVNGYDIATSRRSKAIEWLRRDIFVAACGYALFMTTPPQALIAALDLFLRPRCQKVRQGPAGLQIFDRDRNGPSGPSEPSRSKRAALVGQEPARPGGTSKLPTPVA